VAIAFDEAFNRYFPDTLDSLEVCGAAVLDFSPLRDETIPKGTDIVYFGCGQPERFARTLSENHCMAAALRNHVRSGGRIYAEGGGAAYLCQQMEVTPGHPHRMVGLLPATAHFVTSDMPPVPVELTLAEPSWLGLPGTKVRGYRNSHWRLEPICSSAGLIREVGHRNELIGSLSAVGSLLHLNFAAQTQCLHHFFYPYRCRRVPADPWADIRPSARDQR
jgi:cobyrinic acid a,c-diamide synthase